MKTLLPVAILVTGMLLPRMVSGQTVDAWTQEALRNNPRLVAAQLSPSMLRASARSARAWPDPQLELAWLPYRVFTARGSQRSRIMVQQTLPTPGLRAVTSHMADLEADALSWDAASLALDLQKDVREIHDDLYRIQQLDALIRSYDARLSSFEEVALNRYETGQETLPPVLNLQLERNALSLRLDRLAETRADLQARLSVVLGRDGPVEIPSTLAPRDAFVSMPEGAATALDRRPDMAGLRSRLDRANHGAYAARRKEWPTVKLGIQYIDTAPEPFPPTATGRDAMALSASINLPLDRRRQRASEENAETGIAILSEAITARAQEVTAEIEALRSRFSAQKSQLERLNGDLLPRARQARESALSAYTAGRSSFLILLEAERMLFQLNENCIETNARLLHTQSRLLRALAR